MNDDELKKENINLKRNLTIARNEIQHLNNRIDWQDKWRKVERNFNAEVQKATAIATGELAKQYLEFVQTIKDLLKEAKK